MDHEQELTERIIGCAISVHRALGPGLLESAYVGALCIEFAHEGISHERERRVPLQYRGTSIGEYRIDLVVENREFSKSRASCGLNRSLERRF